MLYEITRSEFGTVNGAHHQNVDPNAVGNNLKVNAYSEGEKNMIERLDFKGQPNKAFMLFVQWHLESIQDSKSIFSKNIKSSFLEPVRNSI